MPPRQITIAKERQTINDAIRLFFKSRGYIEVETPMVVRSPGMEPNLVPFETQVIEPNGTIHSAALITSPEYSMKKLLGSGMEKIFTLTKVFRNEEAFGGNHNPEFTLLEWYKQGADYQSCMDETENLIQSVQRVFASEYELLHKDKFDQPFSRLRIRDLFLEKVGVDLDEGGSGLLKKACLGQGIHITEDDTESDLFYRLFLTKIEPELQGNVFVYDYPKYQASLARLTPDKKYGERFELYMNGLELCNGFTELTNAEEQRSRFLQESQERESLSRRVYPIDETFLNLLPSVQSPAFGNALGVDRLHMICANRQRIEDVLLFSAQDLFI